MAGHGDSRTGLRIWEHVLHYGVKRLDPYREGSGLAALLDRSIDVDVDVYLYPCATYDSPFIASGDFSNTKACAHESIILVLQS